MLFRQGDVFIESATSIPSAAIRRSDVVLAEGELTGHEHRIDDPSTAVLYEHRGLSFLQVLAEHAHLVHDEHGTIVLERGNYRFWRQREYDARSFSPDGGRFVQD